MKKRTVAIFCLICFIMSLLMFRLNALGNSEELSAAANRQGTKSVVVSTSRGMIYDCNYNKLVNTEKSYVASVLPTAESATTILDYVPTLNRASVLEQLETGNLFVTKLASPLPEDTDELHTFPVYQRYSENQLAAHIIGHMTNDNTDGGYGIEKAYDDFLKEHTVQSKITYYLNAKGQQMQGKPPQITLNQPSSAGVVLTLDSRIQKIAEDAGKKYLSKGAVVVMTPDGKIRGCASFPDFDPNNIAASVKDEANKPMFNRAFGAYNVGSTFKVVTAATALENGISDTLKYRCVGNINVYGQNFNCHKHEGHGTLNMERAMAESCNPYYISLGLKLDKPKFLQMAKDLSYSKSTLLAPGMTAQGGHLPSLTELVSPAATANFSFGQGTLMATPIQVSQMIASVVNGGKTPVAKLVEGLSEDGQTLSEANQEAAPTNAMSKETAEKLRQFLVFSVMDKSNQQAKPTKTTAGGKTATAQTGNYVNGEEIVHGWFTGFFPAENPKYIVTVLCESAESGNLSASPVFREIADQITEQILS